MTDPHAPLRACDDELLSLTESLCRIPSWWRPADRPGAVPRHNEMALAEAVARTLQEVTKLKGAVQLTPPETLPNDGKVISDGVHAYPRSFPWTCRICMH